MFRLKSPKTTTLLFGTGKMVCTGAKSEAMVRKAVKIVVQQLRKGKIKIKKDATVTNKILLPRLTWEEKLA